MQWIFIKSLEELMLCSNALSEKQQSSAIQIFSYILKYNHFAVLTEYLCTKIFYWFRICSMKQFYEKVLLVYFLVYYLLFNV